MPPPQDRWPARSRCSGSDTVPSARSWNLPIHTDESARTLNTLPRYVASTTLTEPQWTRTTIIGDVIHDVSKLKKQPGRRIIVVGSARLTRALSGIRCF